MLGDIMSTAGVADCFPKSYTFVHKSLFGTTFNTGMLHIFWTAGQIFGER